MSAIMSSVPSAIERISMEEQGRKDSKLWKVYQLLKKKISSDVESAERKTTVGPKDTEGGKQENRIVELQWEADVEHTIKITTNRTITVGECKKAIAEGADIPMKNIQLMKNGKKLELEDEILPEPGEKIYLEFSLDDTDREMDEVAEEAELKPRVGVKKVMMRRQDGQKKYLEVATKRGIEPRQYFGGYRNKLTNTEYHHAKVQTSYKSCAERNLNHENILIKMHDNATQTLLPQIDKGMNTMQHKSVQMSERGMHIPALSDKIMTARPYLEYREARRTMTPAEAVIILQRAWRHYIDKKKVRYMYSAIHEEKLAKLRFEGSSLEEFRKQQIALLTRASFPASRADFYDLYTVLGEWTRRHKKEIDKRSSGFARKVAAAALQSKQMQGLLAIEEHRIQEKEENLQKQDMMFLEGTARSRVRTYPNGSRTFIDDSNIQRARDLKEIYANYSRTDVNDTERIEILTSLKNCLAAFEDVHMTSELIEILEREVDLITMGIDKQNLEYLRKRFQSLFIDLSKNPEFNPQAKYYRKSSEEEKKYPMHRCISCHKVLFPSHMFMHLRMKRFRVCTSCSYMHTTATASVNLAPYKRILNALRAAEIEKGCRSAIPFLLQPTGMYFLVSVLWDGRSILNGSSYLPGLRVTRWLPNEEWSMWNMILLTELEAYKHEKLDNPMEQYSKEFVLNVMNRNILGRIHFNMVADIDLKFRERERIGVLPKDHLLYTTKKAAGQLPKNNPHPFLVPNTGGFGGRNADRRNAGS